MKDRYECIQTFSTGYLRAYLEGTEICEETYNALPEEHKKNFVRFSYVKRYQSGYYTPLTHDILNMLSKKDDNETNKTK